MPELRCEDGQDLQKPALIRNNLQKQVLICTEREKTMSDTYERLIEEIRKQQKEAGEYGDAYAVGEQLKDIARESEHNADVILTDLGNKDMDIKAAAGKIKAYADAIHAKSKSNCVFVPPAMADEILRTFYGLEAANGQEAPAENHGGKGGSDDDLIDLDSFFSEV